RRCSTRCGSRRPAGVSRSASTWPSGARRTSERRGRLPSAAMRPGGGLGAACGALALILSAPAAAASGPAWQEWLHIPGVVDVGGPRTDGQLVVAGSGRLYLVDPAGTFAPFAAGPSGYADDAGAEAYLAVAPALPAAGSGCTFA